MRIPTTATMIPASRYQEAYGSAKSEGSSPLSGEWSLTNAINRQVSYEENPQGRLTNSYLEMAEVLIQYMVLKQELYMQFAWAGMQSDKMPTVVWSKRMAKKSHSCTVTCLLRGLAAIQIASRSGPLNIASISVVFNACLMLYSADFSRIVCLTLSFFPTFLTLYLYHRNNLRDMYTLRQR